MCFYLVKRDDKTRGSLFPVHFEVTCQLEIHHCVREVLVDIAGQNNTFTQPGGDSKGTIGNGGAQLFGKGGEPFFEIFKLKKIHNHSHLFLTRFFNISLAAVAVGGGIDFV
jgi:hypothetical protein